MSFWFCNSKLKMISSILIHVIQLLLLSMIFFPFVRRKSNKSSNLLTTLFHFACYEGANSNQSKMFEFQQLCRHLCHSTLMNTETAKRKRITRELCDKGFWYGITWHIFLPSFYFRSSYLKISFSFIVTNPNDFTSIQMSSFRMPTMANAFYLLCLSLTLFLFHLN